MQVVVGLDVGTTGAKALAIDPSGNVCARAGQLFEHPPYQPEPGMAEQDASEWWRASQACLQELTRQLEGVTIQAIAVDSTSGTFVPVDSELQPLAPALMYNDGRARDIQPQVNKAANELTAKFGYSISATFTLTKLVWLRQHQPHIVASTHKFLHAADFIVAQLTSGQFCTDTSNALKTGVDLLTGEWPAFIEETLEIPLEKFPAVARPGDQVGVVSAQAAAATGLPVHMPVIAGATDGTASFLASGAQRVGDWNLNVGTTIAIRGIASGLIRDPQGRYYCHRHPEGLWLPGGASNVGGEALLQVFGSDRIDQLDHDAAACLPSPLIVYPLTRRGERMPFSHSEARGFEIGAPSNDAERFAGYLEGIALITAWSVATAHDLGAETHGDFYLSGGAAHGQQLGRILASALDRPLRITKEPEAALGSALLAGGWAWHDGSVSRAQAAMVQIAHIIEPQMEWVKPLRTKYEELKRQCQRRGYL